MAHIRAGAVVCGVQGPVSCDLGDEAAILDLKSGVYYGLNAVGARIWALLQQPRRTDEIRDALVAEYDVEAQRCEDDLLSILRELQTHGLIGVGGAATS